MKICMFLLSEFTHDARVTKEARTLLSAGHEVTIVALKSKDIPKKESKYGIEVHRINVVLRYILPKGSVFFFIKYLEYIVKAVFLGLIHAFDIYHAHDLDTLPVGYIVSRLKGKPLIYDSHELYIDATKQTKLTRLFWHRIEKALAKKPNVTIMENESRAQIYVQRYNVPMPQTIMNCQKKSIIVSGKKNYLREKYQIDNDKKILIYQGVISPARGMDELLEVMEYFDDKKIVLFVVGYGDYKKQMFKKLENHPQKEQIFIVGPVSLEELPNYTASADIGISLLRNTCLNNYYALSNKIFEYLAAGLPVVFSDFPEMRKVIVGNNVGVVVNESDPQKIASSIRALLNDPEKYEQMSKNAKRIIEEKYNWEIEADKLLKIYSNFEK